MTWAYADYAKKKDGFQYYNYSQTVMYDSIVSATRQLIQDYPEVKFVVPCGTAVQNLRNGFLGDNVNRDGSHLNLYFGRYLTAYTFFATLFGEETAMQNSYVPYCMNEFTMEVIRKAALDAVRNPYAVTPQVYPDYDGDNKIIPADIQFNFTTEAEETSGWNNLSLHHNFLAGLKDVDGSDPCIFITCNEEFTNTCSNGPSVSDTPLNMPAEVSKTGVYGYSEGDFSGQHQKPKGVITFHHLNKSLAYDFTFFASRMGATDNRETSFQLVGTDSLTAVLDASGNANNTVTIDNIRPDKDGIITLTVSAGPNNNNPYRFYYINALRISAHKPTIPSETAPEVLAKYSGLGLPLVCITTTDGMDPTSEGIMHPEGLNGASITNVVPKEARMQIFRADTLWYDSGEYMKDESGIKIKHRGNTSAYYFKNKPFKLKLQKKADLVEFHEEGDTVNRKSKDWVLLNDAERLHVYIANQMSRLVGMEFTPRMEFANVIINNDYRGIYMLSENVKRDKDCRINVDKDDGYIIELDSYFWNDTFSIPSKLNRVMQWTMKYPEAEDLTEEMEANIRADIERLEAAVDADNYPEVIDITSVARWILLHDILGTFDPAGANIYVARQNTDPTSLMRMPVAWDLGSSMNNNEVDNAEVFSWTHTERGLFFSRLFANEKCRDFVHAYIDEWKRVVQSGAMQKIKQFLQSFPSSPQGQGLTLSYPLHTKRWHFGSANVTEMTQSAMNWLANREGWMNRQVAELEGKSVVRILTIGNSYSGDMVESWLSSMAKARDIQIVVGNAARAGYGLRKHWTDLAEGNATLDYRKLVGGTYTSTSGHSLADIINDEQWDYITFQQNSEDSGLYDTYSPYLRKLIDYVKDVQPQAKLGWVMTWAYAGDQKDREGFKNYNCDQMVMYNAILNAVGQALVDYPELEFVIPCGTAVQNLRSSFLGDNVNRDGSHLNLHFGRYLAACTFFATLFGEEAVMQNSYMPYYLNDFTAMVIRQAAVDAVKKPFAITPQVYPDYVGDNDVFPADIQLNFSSEAHSIPGWNNIGLHHNFLAGMKDVNGSDPNIFIFSNAEFSAASTNGPSTTDTPLGMPADVSRTQMFGYSQGNFSSYPVKPAAILHFKHLNKALAYDFTFFASRSGATDNRETQFTLAGTDTLTTLTNAADNPASIATISGMRPDEDGTITLTVTAGPNNDNPYRFYYLNALRISVHDTDFALEGDDRPIPGDSLSISFKGDLSKYTVNWTRGDALGTFDDANILSSTKDYVITENDYEHWLRVTISDNMGNTVFSKNTWISKLPVLYVDTEGGKPIVSKEDYVTASCRIQGNADFEQQYAGEVEIRGRGQTSWATYPQKPYKLKLDKKTKLFGFGKSKHWVLISNFNDKSCLRNYTASQLAKELGVLGMNMTWVDVVLNGEVKGCYMLSQHIRVDKHSVNIFDWEGEAEDVADSLFAVVKDADALEETDKKLLEKAMEQNLAWITDGMVTFKEKTYNLLDYGLKKAYDITEGYLFEGTDKTNGISFFETPQTVQIEVCRPEYTSTNSTMFSYVKDLWKNFEAEYCQVPPQEGKNFSKYADMESMVGLWLVNEIMGQDDQHNSRYSYIPGDKKLHFGPVWDFDHGGGSWSVTTFTDIFYTLYRDKRYAYYRKWFPDPWLCQMAYDAYWSVARPFIMEYISEGSEMDAKYAHFAEAGRTNDTLWGSHPRPQDPNTPPRTTAEDVEIFRAFLSGHINWLDQQFQSVKSLIEAMNKTCPYPCDPDTIHLLEKTADGHTGARKIIKDKHLYIIKDGKTYSIDGKRIK